MSGEKLGGFLKEVSNWTWEQYIRAENDSAYTSNQGMIFALIRSCAMQKLDAIKMSLNRIDGKLKTPVKIESPKMYYLYPNAAMDESLVKQDVTEILETEPDTTLQVVSGDLLPPPNVALEDEDDLPSMSLRQTLTKLADMPRQYPDAIVEFSQQVEHWVKRGGPLPDENPMVKSVVSAHLLLMAQRRDIGAITEVFDQIDGKLVETIQIIGEDIYIPIYSSTAPAGAIVNSNGVLQIEATVAQNMWAQKLGGTISA